MSGVKLNYIYIPSTGEIIYQNPLPLIREAEMSIEEVSIEEMSMEEYLHKKVKIPLKKGWCFEDLHLIKLIEIKNDKLHIHVEGKQPPLSLDRTMGEILPLFPEPHFYQCHESYLFNIHYPVKYLPGEPDKLEIKGNISIPISRPHKEKVVAALNNISICIPSRKVKSKQKSK